MFSRHEEYKRLPSGIPFHMNPDVTRTANLCSAQSNWHEDLEIQYCTEGEGYLLLDAEKHPFRKGEIAVINSDVVHYTGTDSRIVYDCLIVDAAFCRESGINLSALSFACRPDSTRLQAHMEALRRCYEEEAMPFRAARLRMLLLALLLDLCENHTAAVPTASEDRALDTVKAAIVYIREHYGEKLTLEGIAAHVLTDKYTLLRHFKRITGDSVFSYLIGYRCKMALLMLSDGADVAEAAYATGFSNLSYFSKTFRAKVGKLPSECKAGAQEGRAPAHP